MRFYDFLFNFLIYFICFQIVAGLFILFNIVNLLVCSCMSLVVNNLENIRDGLLFVKILESLCYFRIFNLICFWYVWFSFDLNKTKLSQYQLIIVSFIKF